MSTTCSHVDRGLVEAGSSDTVCVRLVPVEPFRVTRVLAGIVLTLSMASALVVTGGQVLRLPHMGALVSLFYVDLESSIPTWYSSFALLLAAVLLSAIAATKAQQHDRYRRHWAALACLFLGLSVDEVAMLHELPILPLRAALNGRGFLYYTWVIPGSLFVLFVSACFFRFLRTLPLRTRNMFIGAAGLYVGGAIGVEMVSGYVASGWSEQHFAYVLIVNVEEFLEMMGVVVFIHALLDYGNSTAVECHLASFAFPKRSAKQRAAVAEASA